MRPVTCTSVGRYVEIWAPVHIFCKSDSYQFLRTKYISFKEKDVSIFSCSINATVTSQNGKATFYETMCITSDINLNYHIFFCFCPEVVANVCKRLKEGQNNILIQCRPKFNVILTMLWRWCAEKWSKNAILKMSVCLAI